MSNYFVREIENLKTKEELLDKKEDYIDYLQCLESTVKAGEALFGMPSEIENVKYYLELINKRLEEE